MSVHYIVVQSAPNQGVMDRCGHKHPTIAAAVECWMGLMGQEGGQWFKHGAIRTVRDGQHAVLTEKECKEMETAIRRTRIEILDALNDKIAALRAATD